MKLRTTGLTTAALVLLLGVQAQAHFLWIVADHASSQAKVYFSESASPDDPDLLERVADAKLLKLLARDKSEEVGLEKKGDALVAALEKAGGLALSKQYGVLDRGGEKFLLYYHATSQTSAIDSDWKRLGGDKVSLEIVPARKGNKVELTVYWQGKPLADAVIVVNGAGVDAEGKTGSDGKFVVEPKEAGLLEARAKHVVNEAGKAGDKAYDSVRHWTTLTVPVSVSTVQSLETKLPEVPKGITSFGAAIAGDDVFVYAGHWGGAHHYWKEGQSNELLRLNLKKGDKWEVVATGDRRTGLTMVSYQGKLIAIGGFEALNAENDDKMLRSTADVRRFDPAKNQFESLPSLPVPVSSLDATVLGDTLYAVGGWSIAEGDDGKFIDTMFTLDLKAEKPEWKSHSVPFKRRAVSAAAFKGKLYVIGGMQEKGGATTETDIYDPATQSWSKGPSLHGQPLEGFGTTSFEIGGKLTTITMSGAIQQLAQDGKSWVIAGYLKNPRFFARLLPIDDGRGIVIAGAHMGSGKINATEVIGEASR